MPLRDESQGAWKLFYQNFWPEAAKYTFSALLVHCSIGKFQAKKKKKKIWMVRQEKM
jgi:hypothetical protein